MDRTPLMLVGDGPQEATGLGRILRDLGQQIVTSDLPVELVSVGGCVPPVWPLWPHYPLDERLHRGDDWGARYVEALWRSHFGARPGILWGIWDPARLYHYLHVDLPVQRWAYTPIDAANGGGSIGGPARDVLQQFDRVIAYGRWASTIIKTVRTEPVPYLPHGILPAVSGPTSAEDRTWAAQQLGPHVPRGARVVGCVATNQPRKDFGLFFQTLAVLRQRGWPVYGWLHTDVLVKAWSVQQLVDDFGLAKRVTVSTVEYTDRELAVLYQACGVTLAPGLGEGFGYPIVESLAAGVPVVHADTGGGRELVPKIEWRLPVREVRLESVYALQRPVLRADDTANAIERAWAWQDAVGGETAAAYCRGAVAHLDWRALWGRWHAWIAQGL